MQHVVMWDPGDQAKRPAHPHAAPLCLKVFKAVLTEWISLGLSERYIYIYLID